VKSIAASVGAGLCLACVIAACAPQVIPPAAPLSADPAETYSMVRQREDAIETLRARFSATVRQGDKVRRAEGVLLVKKPDRFRLRLLSPFGFTVFDYVTQGSHARMELPLEGKRLVDDEIGTQSAFSPLDLQQAFLRGEAAFPGDCTSRAADAEVAVDCRNADHVLLREIRIARATATVTRETSFTNGAPRLTMTFDDYRTIGGLPLPFAIELGSPERDVTMQITLRAYEINPVLADALFDAASAAS
jgi:hypothetical protein